jgi:DNA repair protein RadC
MILGSVPSELVGYTPIPWATRTSSKADIAVTKDIVKAAQPLGVSVHDHLIIGRGRHTSLGLM